MAEETDRGSTGSSFRSLFLMLFAALFGYVGMQVRTPAKTPAAASKNTPKEQTKAREAEDTSVAAKCPALLPLRAYLSVELDACPGAGGLWKDKQWLAQLQAKGVRDVSIVIATIPDPDTVTYAHYATQAVESLRRAAEGAGYSPDRHWFPWFGEQEEGSRKHFGPRSDEPGSLLFRQLKEEGTELLLVLLASETPTRGVHQPALRKALEYAIHLRRQMQSLRVVGPSYSGSAISLRQTIEEKLDSIPAVSIITGTATNPRLPSLLSTGKICFSTVIENDGEADERMRGFLAGYRGMTGSIAVVTEAGTDYAAGLKPDVDLNPAPAASNAFTYTFPMEISQVRNAYQKDPELQDSGAKSGEKRTGLALRLSEEQSGYETIPNWAGEAGTVAKEFALRRLGDQIAEQSPAIITLGASDVRDVLFVGGFLRKRFDDAQLVLLDSDVLYGNTTQALSMRGVLSVATYPLLLEAQAWEGATGLLQFSSQFGHGVFNALTAHLARDRMVQFGALPGAATPPLWMTVFSRGTNWPVAVLPAGKGASTLMAAASNRRLDPQLGPQHAGWIVMETLLLLCTALWGYLFFSDGQWEGYWEKAPTDAALMLPAVVGSGVLLSMHALFGSVQVYYWIWAQSVSWPSMLLGAGNWIAAVVMTLTLFRVVYAAAKKIRDVAVPLGLSVALFLAALCFALLVPAMQRDEGGFLTALFFVHRSYHLGSGVSPMLPIAMFLTLILLGAAAQLLSRWIAYWLNVPIQDDATGKVLGIDQRTADGCKKALLFAAGWTILSVFLFRMGSVSTIEHPHYTRVFLLLFCVSITFMAYGFLRLICLFRVLWNLMHEAGKMNFEEATKKVAEMGVWGVWRFNFRNAATSDKPVKVEGEVEVLRYAQAAQTIIQMVQCQVVFLMAGILLGLFAMQSYPFEPSRTFVNYISFFFLLIGAGTMFIFGRIEAAPFLSELYGTEGKSGFQFYWKTLSRFGLPLLAVLASQFPDIGDLLMRIIKPLLDGGVE